MTDAKQMSFAEQEYQNKKRKTQREKFLEKMEKLIPWQALEAEIAPYYPRGENGRPPYPLSVMLRIHCLQVFYNLSDPAMEDALYDVPVMRYFAGVKMERLPDETTILNFRHFLLEHHLGEKLFDRIKGHLLARGLQLRAGTLVDASILNAASSTKNSTRKRDEEMGSTKKGGQWYFGMKAHIGVDADSGVVHSLETTGANVHDLDMAEKLLHGEEKTVWGDAGYQGVEGRVKPRAGQVKWQIAMRPTKRRQLAADSEELRLEKEKARIRAKVEHPFRYIKCVFGYNKTRYRGLAKNQNRLYLLLSFFNLLRCQKALLS